MAVSFHRGDSLNAPTGRRGSTLGLVLSRERLYERITLLYQTIEIYTLDNARTVWINVIVIVLDSPKIFPHFFILGNERAPLHEDLCT